MYKGYFIIELLIIKHQRSTTKLVNIILINLVIVLGVFILFILFLNIIIGHDVAWFNLNFGILYIFIYDSFFLYINQINPNINSVSMAKQKRFLSAKFSVDFRINRHNVKSLSFYNSRFYSTKALSTAEDKKKVLSLPLFFLIITEFALANS